MGNQGIAGMQLKNSEWLMFAALGAAVVLIVIWTLVSGKNDQQFIDTKSIQIERSNPGE